MESTDSSWQKVIEAHGWTKRVRRLTVSGKVKWSMMRACVALRDTGDMYRTLNWYVLISWTRNTWSEVTESITLPSYCDALAVCD